MCKDREIAVPPSVNDLLHSRYYKAVYRTLYEFIYTIIKTTRLSVTEAVSVTGWRSRESRPELETVGNN